MDAQQFATVLIGVVTTIVSWWVRNIWAMLQKQQDMIVNLQVELARSYMPRQEVHESLKRIFDKLDEIQSEMGGRK